jgi:hypothetical protein
VRAIICALGVLSASTEIPVPQGWAKFFGASTAERKNFFPEKVTAFCRMGPAAIGLVGFPHVLDELLLLFQEHLIV